MMLVRRKLCACGCGRTAPLIRPGPKTARRLWWTHRRFISGHNRRGTGRPFDLLLAPPNERGCILWLGAVRGNGYGVFSGSGDGNVSAHVYAYERAKGPVSFGLLVLHDCDTKLCCNPEHLDAGTYSKNLKDAYARGLHSRPGRGSW